jgi:RHS repeat-associated protein
MRSNRISGSGYDSAGDMTSWGVSAYPNWDQLGKMQTVTGTGTPAQVLASHDYYPFGSEASSTTQDTERMKFTGQERDLMGTSAQTDDLDDMHARFYNPNIGRFLSTDLLRGDPYHPQSFNLFAYVRDNPTNYTDPYGLQGEDPLNRETASASDSIVVVALDPGIPWGVYGIDPWAWQHNNWWVIPLLFPIQVRGAEPNSTETVPKVQTLTLCGSIGGSFSQLGITANAGLRLSLGDDWDARIYAERQYTDAGLMLSAGVGGFYANDALPPAVTVSGGAVVSGSLSFSGRSGRSSLLPTGGGLILGPGGGISVTSGQPTPIFDFSVKDALTNLYNSAARLIPGECSSF